MAKVRNADQYKARHAKRGAKLASKPGWSDMWAFGKSPEVKRIGHGMKPNHSERTCTITAPKAKLTIGGMVPHHHEH